MDAHQIFDQVSAAMKKRPHRESGVPTLRGCLPVMRRLGYQATKCRVSLMGDYVLAHCYGCEAPSRDLLAAFGIEREPGTSGDASCPCIHPAGPETVHPRTRTAPPAHIPFASAEATTLQEHSVSSRAAAWSTRIPTGARVGIARWATPDEGKETRNPGIAGPGWYARIWLPRVSRSAPSPSSFARVKKTRHGRLWHWAIRGIRPRRGRAHGQRGLHCRQGTEPMKQACPC